MVCGTSGTDSGGGIDCRIAVMHLAVLVAWVGAVRTVYAEGATRDLSGYVAPGSVFTVSIAVDTPPGIIAAGLEDAPPAGWIVSNISDSGTWDPQTEKVKWGPFFDPSIPAVVTYDVAPPIDAVGQYCFAGSVSFDTASQSIAGDQCLGRGIPTSSEWGMVAMTLLVLCGGTAALRHRHFGHLERHLLRMPKHFGLWFLKMLSRRKRTLRVESQRVPTPPRQRHRPSSTAQSHLADGRSVGNDCASQCGRDRRPAP